MKHRHHVPLVVLALLAMMLPVTSSHASDRDGETFRYRWSLGGVAGVVAGLFLPSHGEGVLSYQPAGNGRITSELLITSEKSDKGEFWRYGSEIDPGDGTSVKAWSSYLWRGEKKSKQQDIEVGGVRDIVAGIYMLRSDPPTEPRPMEIWSDGKIYPVLVTPEGEETIKVGGRPVATRHYSIRGRRVPGGREWKGGMELWLAKDEAATPVEIRIERSMARLKLELVDSR